MKVLSFPKAVSLFTCFLFMTTAALAGSGEKGAKETTLADISSEAMSYTVAYPSEWFAELAFSNQDRPEHVIVEMSRFTTPQAGEITISVWERSDSGTLQSWLDRNAGMLSLAKRDMTSGNVTRFGLESRTYIFDNTGGHAANQMKTYFQQGKQVFEVSYYMADQGAATDQYHALIESLSFDISSERKLQPSNGERPAAETRVYSCGGYNDDCYCAAWNPFPCCSNGGNCTWWAWHMACCNWGVDVPPRGNANTWAGSLAAGGYYLSSWPAVGRIACRNSGTYGHVAWVTGVSGDYVTVSEMNCWGNYGARTYTYHKSYFDGGYAYR